MFNLMSNSHSENLAENKSDSAVEQYYICDACRKFFIERTLSYRQSPPLYCTRSGPLICSACHKEIIISDNGGSFDCSFCDRKFSRESDLNLHLFFHLYGRVFVCPLCPRLCVSRNLLNRHLRIHTGERPHVCDICQKGYNTTNELGSHFQKCHTDETKCDLCGGKFYSKHYLERHVKKCHDAEKRVQLSSSIKCRKRKKVNKRAY